jgi:UDP-3-O-[3-hydroxymyristoyl] glucosamine N-acyltransferase
MALLMKFEKPISVKTLAEWTGSRIIGDQDRMAGGINEIHKVVEGDITFVDLEKYYDKSLGSKASIIIIDKEVEAPTGKTLLLNENPFEAYNGIVDRFRPFSPITKAIHPTADIHPSVHIEPNVIIGEHVKIGADSHIMANTYIGSYTEIGERTSIQPGCIIGSDAFYYKRHPDYFTKWTSCGRVVIGDDVEIGAGCTLDKGVSGDTVIGTGTKFDCQIHIGHGAVVGKHCLFAAQVGVGGKTIIGDHVVLYGQVGIAQNLVIGDRVVVLAKSGVSKNVESGRTLFGYPAVDAKEMYKQLAALRRLGKE